MVSALLFRDGSGSYSGFSLKGHAGFAKRGEDIVCAACSVLAINTANALEALAEMPLDIREKEGLLEVFFRKSPDEKAVLLMDALAMGLKGIEQEYGKKHLKVEEKTEVCHAEN